MTLEIIILCVGTGFIVGVIFTSLVHIVSRYFDGK